MTTERQEQWQKEKEALPSTIKPAVPADYFVLQIVRGNLNLDPAEDVLLVIARQSEGESKSDENSYRRMLIFTGSASGTFTLSAQSEKVVLPYRDNRNFADSLTDLTIIAPGTFSIGHFGGFEMRWSKETVFKFSPATRNGFSSANTTQRTLQRTPPKNPLTRR